MARVSFLLDFLAKKLGIKGTSFISLILGFGCNVPAIYSTRTLTSFKERVITSLMIPFMSCSARLPVYALFTSIFFPNNGPMVIMGLYLLGIFVAFVYGYILNRVLVKQESKPFFLELPDYHMPTFLAIYNLMWPKLKDFIVRAGTVILLASVILWIFINLPPNSKPQESILAKSAQKIAPIFEPAGFGKNWEAVAALIPGTVAKEVVISSLGTIYASNVEKEEKIYNFKEDSINIIISLKDAIADSVVSIFRFSKEEEESFESSLTQKIKNSFNPLSAFSYMIFVLLYIPCISTMAAIKHEFGTKWMIFESFLLLLIAYIVSTLFYQISTLVF